ncbi:hypothetical protein EDB81DRAFT_805174 [Dactylonectria macrodidyma]|uniref:Secreted protein n=1 Tax=Dactylonectria macrodidyma TaxID=307937 RepID=A0A9P9EAZ1_9HYPO|nr:hypothetical protein EDB81DRAFT_805174 [Dactylonectria macrodidyma]
MRLFIFISKPTTLWAVAFIVTQRDCTLTSFSFVSLLHPTDLFTQLFYRHSLATGRSSVSIQVTGLGFMHNLHVPTRLKQPSW